MERVLKILKRYSFLNQGVIENEIKQYLENMDNCKLNIEDDSDIKSIFLIDGDKSITIYLTSYSMTMYIDVPNMYEIKVIEGANSRSNKIETSYSHINYTDTFRAFSSQNKTYSLRHGCVRNYTLLKETIDKCIKSIDGINYEERRKDVLLKQLMHFGVDNLDKFADKKNKVEFCDNKMRIYLTPANPNGYEITQEEYEKMKEMGISLRNKEDELRYPNPLDFPQLYLSEEDYDRIYEEVVGKVLRKKD